MENFHKLHLLLFASLLLLPSNAEPPTSHGYKCSSSSAAHYPCQSFAFYRAGADPSLLDLASVGDLFSVSRLMIARATNITVDAPLRPNQPLLIPLSCSCVSNRSFAATPYQILAGDTFYIVSSFKFGNLTSYPAVEDANPSLVPTNLTIGVLVTFPIFCSCPSNRSQSIVTYSLQPSDSYRSIATAFGSDLRSLISLNGHEGSLLPYSTILIPISQIPPPSMRIYSPHLPPPPPPAATTVVRRNREGPVVGMGIALGVMGLLWLLLLLLIGLGIRRGKRRRDEKPSSWEDKKVVVDVAEWLDKYKVYGIDELREATADFDSGCLIRGSVYRGEIDGEVYAIKKMKWNASEELKILQKDLTCGNKFSAELFRRRGGRRRRNSDSNTQANKRDLCDSKRTPTSTTAPDENSSLAQGRRVQDTIGYTFSTFTKFRPPPCKVSTSPLYKRI